jgi:hypothetical protein
MSDLASTISILARIVWKKGQLCAIARSSPLSAKSASAWPAPYQPGSITRACAQLNTQGMARKSSILACLVRLDGREPIFSVAISEIGVICRKKVVKPVSLIDQPAIGGEGLADKLVHRRGKAGCICAGTGSGSSEASNVAEAMVSRLATALSTVPYFAAMTSPCSVMRIRPLTVPCGCAWMAPKAEPPPRPTAPPRPWKQLHGRRPPPQTPGRAPARPDLAPRSR